MAFPVIDRREHTRILRFCKALPAGLSILVILSGVISLVLWWRGYGNVETDVGPIVMLPVTAACFIVSGVSLLVAQRRDSRIAIFISRLLAVILAGMTLFVLFEYGTGSHLRLDLLWFPPDLSSGTPRRMAVNTASAFVLFGQGLIFLDGDRRTQRLRSQFFATLTLIILFIAVVGHMLAVSDFSLYHHR